MKSFGKTIFFTGLMFLAAACNNPQASKITPAPSPAYNYDQQLQVGSETLSVEIATSTAAMQQGLSDRISMDQDEGMLFDFGKGVSAYPSFWMKDMDFNLDFIWISQNKIVGITPDAAATSTDDKNLPYYYPPSAVNEVLEVNAGWAKKNNITVGDNVKLISK
jgi:uncharacterized membrane protein (UPF0127 family)